MLESYTVTSLPPAVHDTLPTEYREMLAGLAAQPLPHAEEYRMNLVRLPGRPVGALRQADSPSSPRTTTASAVSRARSEPARPIAMPLCAAASAGASFTPSPTTRGVSAS